MVLKKIINYIEGDQKCFQYVIVEHSGINAFDFVADYFQQAKCNIILVGSDGPECLSEPKAIKICRRLQKKSIGCEMAGHGVYYSHPVASLLYSEGILGGEGDAFLLTTDKKPVFFGHLPKPAGWACDSISNEDVQLLGQYLSATDIYFYDDFEECFIVSKNKSAMENIKDKVRSYQFV